MSAARSRCRVAASDVSPISLRGGEDVAVREASSDTELRATAHLRVRTFSKIAPDSVGAENYKKSLVEQEFEALRDRIQNKVPTYRRVSCINVTLPLSLNLLRAVDLCSTCQFPADGEDRVVVATLDLNQCLWLPNELTGKRPEISKADLRRAYLSNVCVAKELQRNGLGYKLLTESKKVARKWGITDLYVHVAVDNEAAHSLYRKAGFIIESEEPAWKARFLARTQRFLLWTDLSCEDSA